MQQTQLGLLASFCANGRKTLPSGSVNRYQLSFADPYGHYLESQLWVDDVSAGQAFSLPTWIPGSYMIRDFSKHVVSATAESAGRPVALRMADKATWVVDKAHAELCITLRVYAFDDSVRAAWFDESRAFVNGTSVFLRVQGREDWPCVLDIQKPSHPALQSWRLATGLDVIEAEDWSFGRFAADDYHALIDHPIEAGDFTLLAFEACGAPHVMLLAGSHQRVSLNESRLCKDLVSICEAHIRRFEPATQAPPFNRYLFLTHVTANGYGGLEHRNSTALICSTKDLPTVPDVAEPDEHYQQFLGLCSHEYFHSWNVKRITPAAFISPDYQSENYSTLLWAFEGITSYYDDLTVYQSGAIAADAWLTQLGQTITRVYRGAGRLGQSVAESSFTAWTRFYQQDANATNAIVSYYAKGALVSLCLDLLLRKESHGQVTLDVLMQALWQRYGKTLKGVPENAIEALAVEMLPDAATNLERFLSSAVYGTEDLPIEELLGDFGVKLNWRAAGATTDKGGKDVPPWRVWLGAAWKQVGNELEVIRVDNNSPAHKAGIAVKDRLAAINGYRASADWIERELLHTEPATEWHVAVFRGEKLMQKSIQLDAAPLTSAWLTLATEVGPEQLARREAWLQC